jgi:hypothetical protein
MRRESSPASVILAVVCLLVVVLGAYSGAYAWRLKSGAIHSLDLTFVSPSRDGPGKLGPIYATKFDAWFFHPATTVHEWIEPNVWQGSLP